MFSAERSDAFTLPSVIHDCSHATLWYRKQNCATLYFSSSLNEVHLSTLVDARQAGCSFITKVDVVTDPLPLSFCSFGQIGDSVFKHSLKAAVILLSLVIKHLQEEK